MSTGLSQNDGWTFTAPYRGPPQRQVPAQPPSTITQLSNPTPELTALINRLNAATDIPQHQRDQFAILDLWDALRSAHWTAVRMRECSLAEVSWPTFVTRSFGDRTDEVLKLIYHQQYEEMARRDWKALVRFYRVQRSLNLSPPAVFLHLGRQVATSASSLKVLCKLLDNPSRLNYPASDVIDTIKKAIAAKELDGSEPAELDHQSLIAASRELRRIRRTNPAAEDDVNRVATELNNLAIHGSTSTAQPEDN
ncbi:hypothetical protein GCG54_00015605, partial [Colletotrichum gloeosporioides]